MAPSPTPPRLLITQTYGLTLEERKAISHSFGEKDPAGYVVLEQFLRDVVRTVLDSLVDEYRKAQKAAANPPKLGVRVRKRPRRTAEDGDGTA